MQIRYFAHSWLSDWNHGNAHFLRGWMSALVRRGHAIRCYEAFPAPRGGWSLSHLLDEARGGEAVAGMRRAYPELEVRLYGPQPPAERFGCPWVESWEAELRDADFVLVHEWNPAELFEQLLVLRRQHGFRLLLHDTHHRAISEPAMLERLPLRELDGVIAFGESLRQVYERAGARRTYTLHEAADTERFHPVFDPAGAGVVWVGNWGDEERTEELHEFLIAPVRATGAAAEVYGIRYPEHAQQRLAAAGLRYRGYLPNLEVPQAYGSAAVAIHVPRQPYAQALPGIPTIRVFEALACGIPLLSAPWNDAEQLFESGNDYWMAGSSDEMTALLKQLTREPEQRKRLSANGASCVAARHTCAHRALALEAICHDLDCTYSFSVPA